MNKHIAILMAGLMITCWCAGCSTSTETKPTEKTADSAKSSKAGKPEHKTAHGGSLNAIVTCENGHAEVILEGAKLRLWFVGGGTDTTKSVRVTDPSFTLNIKVGSTIKSLTLAAKPLELAGEKIGDCSYFEGSMPELKNAKEFTADGNVTFKGRKMPIRIEYPKGYDPD